MAAALCGLLSEMRTASTLFHNTVPWSKIHERYRLEALTYFIGIRRALARVADALSLVPEKNA